MSALYWRFHSGFFLLLLVLFVIGLGNAAFLLLVLAFGGVLAYEFVWGGSDDDDF